MFAFGLGQAQTFRIVSYNTENLFDTVNDPLTNDDDFTPQGSKQWTSFRYWHKLQHISQIIVNTGEWQQPALVALIEIENDTCLRDLCQRSTLRKFKYKYLQHDSPDPRGIDVALIYDPEQFQLLDKQFIPIDTLRTREILYTKGLIFKIDTLHIIVCHAPSQLGGQDAKERRKIVFQRINQLTDSILQKDSTAQIVLMGDFNDSPRHISPHITSLTNLMLQFNDTQGTYCYQEKWTCLDQFLVSQQLTNRTQAKIFKADWLIKNDKPRRTYQHIFYDHDGYSDHLPIVLDIKQ